MLWIVVKKNQYKFKLSKATSRPFYQFKILLFKNLINKVSPFVFKKVLKQVELISANGFKQYTYKGLFTSQFGLFCHYQIKYLQDCSEVLQMSNINPHWYFNKLPVRLPIPLNIAIYKLNAYIRLRIILCFLLKTLIFVIIKDAYLYATLNTTRID